MKIVFDKYKKVDRLIFSFILAIGIKKKILIEYFTRINIASKLYYIERSR